MKMIQTIIWISLLSPVIILVALAILPRSAQDEKRVAFVTECMEAHIGWREDSNGWYNKTTAKYRVRLHEICTEHYSTGNIPAVMQAVRDGELQVRGIRRTGG